MSMVELRDIRMRYDGDCILDGFSLQVEAGETVCLFGPSGCGKTSAMRLVAGLEQPEAGDVLINGSLVTDSVHVAPPHTRNLGYVFQDLGLWPHMRAARHLDFVLKGRGLSRGERRRRVDELLDLCQLMDRRRAHPNELSGGEGQRLAIARALATEPDILLLDEPFANLDIALRNRIMAEITRRKAENGLTVLLATHNPDESEFFADRVVTMEKRG
ncbi:MAG: ABC transporter ATP-binding protein [bacterium]|nr:ABC transporter ATP-binding protein [bacterium]